MCPFYEFVQLKPGIILDQAMSWCWYKESLCLQNASIQRQDWLSKGEEAGPSEFSNIWSVTCLEPEEVLPLIINLQVAYEQTSFWLRTWHWVLHKEITRLKYRHYFSAENKESFILILSVLSSTQLTYFMVQSHSWEANWFAASQEIPRISRNPKVH